MLLQDDGEVSKLEEECNWFRNETNRLQTHSAAMQHDIQVCPFFEIFVDDDRPSVLDSQHFVIKINT